MLFIVLKLQQCFSTVIVSNFISVLPHLVALTAPLIKRKSKKSGSVIIAW